jgi:hypothetical protein
MKYYRFLGGSTGYDKIFYTLYYWEIITDEFNDKVLVPTKRK